MDKEVSGHWKKMYNPTYLGSWDLEDGKDIIAVIDRVVIEKMHNPSSNEEVEKPVLYFKGGVKPMVLNKTNSKIIAKVVKSDTVEDWKGKSIQLGLEPVKAFGTITDAVRVRSVAPRKATLTPERFAKMLASITAGQFTVAAAKEKFSLSKTQLQELEKLTA